MSEIDCPHRPFTEQLLNLISPELSRQYGKRSRCQRSRISRPSGLVRRNCRFAWFHHTRCRVPGVIRGTFRRFGHDPFSTENTRKPPNTRVNGTFNPRQLARPPIRRDGTPLWRSVTIAWYKRHPIDVSGEVAGLEQGDTMKLSTIIAVAVVLVGAGVSLAENWPCWRGPRGDGTSPDTVPLKWDATTGQNIVWKVPIAFGGHSSPIVWGDRIFVTGADEAKARRVLMAFDRVTGKELWNVDVEDAPLEKKHKLNSWASGTPATDGKLVYVTFLDQKQMLVAAYDISGKEVWKVKPGEFASVHGYCSCPVVFENTVIVNGDHDGDAYIVALDRETGKTIWKTPRENRTRSYCTPIIRDIGGRTQMILSGSKCVSSYDPRTGSRHWILDGPTEQFVASPVENKGLIFITGGFPDKHLIAIDPSGSNVITESSHVKWHHLNKGVSYVPSPVAANDYFFCVADGGVAGCYDAISGDIKWQERLGRHHSGSLVAASGRVYMLDDDGITHVVKAGPKFEVLAANPLGEEAYSSPAISNGQILIRGDKHLFCIGEK